MNAVLQEFQSQLRSAYPAFAGIIDRAYAEFGDPWADDVARNLEVLFGPPGDPRWAEAIKGYVFFSLDVLRGQVYLEQHGRYEASSSAELKESHWDNPEFMLVNYLPGIFVSHFVWPQHYRLVQWFRSEVLPKVAERSPARFCEVGVGSALYTYETLNRFPASRGTGFDISPLALGFGKRVIDAYGVGDRCDWVQCDVVTDTPPPSDFLICQEVIEHIDQPVPFLAALHRMVVPGGRAYITGAVTSGQSDHVYLFNAPGELREMIESVGFTVLLERTETAEAANVRAIAPRVACFLCERS